MTTVEILVMVLVVQCADLKDFKIDELFEFWVNLSSCAADPDFFDEFEEKDQISIKGCVDLLEREFRRRGFRPVNLFSMLRDNPNKLAKLLKSFDIEKLLALQENLSLMRQTNLVKNFLELIDERIMQIIPVA